jgi:hypothetical protein
MNSYWPACGHTKANYECFPRPLTAVVALPALSVAAAGGNVGSILKREGGQAQRRSSQEHVMNVTLATNERVTSTMNGI